MSSRRLYRFAAAVLAILTAGILIGGCSCVITRVIDQANVTVRGLAAANEIAAKANEGYDVRDARAKWLEALDAYNNGDFARADELVDETYDALDGLVKVAERIDYRSSGGLTVSGLLFRPEGEGPWPLIVVNHAGFGTGGDFSDVALGIRDKGYLVFNPDYRGSGGSQGTHEGAKGEVDDVIYGIEYIRSLGLVEGDRIGEYGQSHGGAVSMLAAERYPDIKAVVSESGFYDAVGLYENALASSDPNVTWLKDQFLPMAGGTPEQVPDEYYVRSAINNVDSIQAASLIIHGEKDPLIPVSQAYDMYDALIAAGKTAELKIYPDEAHCVASTAGRLEVWDMMFAWFERYV
jgi:dipeptidyl aminopeptidase/acylaminoacyl peptidase